MDGMYEKLWEYTSHALNYDNLVGILRAYANDPDNADTKAVADVAELIERVVPRKNAELPGLDAYFPALVMLLHSFYGESQLDQKHKSIIKKLVDAA